MLIGKPGKKGPLGRPRNRWEDNIKNISRKQGVRVWTGLINK
jgi:hypothetical protein